MRVLVTGAAGRLGGRLVEVMAARQHVVTGIDLPELDITDYAATHAFVMDHAPDVVLHAAAWTDVDGCARDPDRATAVNGLGAGNIAAAAYAANAAVLYVSSNEVFDGQRGTPYREYDPTNPANPYAYSKWVGEQAVSAANPRHMIVRTAWLFAHGGRNFIQAILNAAEAGKPLRVVTDEVANPTYNDDLAAALADLVAVGRPGVYHLTNDGTCSRYAFARYVLDRAGYAETPVKPITAREWPRDSQPPAYTALVNQSAALLGVRLRPWQEAVDAFLEREGLLR